MLLYRCSDLPQTALPTPVTDVRRSGFAMRSSEVFFMKNILIAATLAASVLLGGCAGSSIWHGRRKRRLRIHAFSGRERESRGRL